MIPYGCITTKAFSGLVAGLAAGQTLTITRAMVGSGCPQTLEEMAALEDLVQPVAAAVSTRPVRQEDAVALTIEYRSDLNGGLKTGFDLSEFGIFAQDGEQEVLILYGTLGEHPQWVEAYTPGGSVDTRRYPCTIPISRDLTVTINYSAAAFVTAEEADEMLSAHNHAPDAHPELQAVMGGYFEEAEPGEARPNSLYGDVIFDFEL